MRQALVRMEYFETYYYANVVHNVLSDTMDWLRSLHEWHEDRAPELFFRTFPKWSVLHDFAHFIIESLMFERLGDEPLDSLVRDKRIELWIDRALRQHGFQTSGFRAWLKGRAVSLDEASEDDIYDYCQELRLSGEVEDLLEQLSNEVFFLVFDNRVLLTRLNGYVAGIVRSISCDEVPEEERAQMAKDGVLARVHIPEWVRRAVFFRDRGMCATCNQDLSGLVSLATVKHFDHIVPLAVGGINDVTNVQLLCDACNLRKGRSSAPVSSHYEAWYTS